MDTAETDTMFEPPAPIPRTEPMSAAKTLYVMTRNRIEAWRAPHFRERAVARKTLIGETIVLMDPAGIRHVMVDNAPNYGRAALQRRFLGTKGTEEDSLLTAEGKFWKRTRRTVAPLFTPKIIAGFLPMMRKAALDAVVRLRAADGEIIDAADVMMRLAFDSLSGTLFSDEIDNRDNRFSHAVTRYLAATGVIDPLDVLGAPSWIPRVGRLLARPTVAFFEREVATLVGARRRAIDARTDMPQDLLTALLLARDPESGEPLNEAAITANILLFIGAGHDTAANTFTWALYLLSMHPNVRNALEAEVDVVDLDALDVAGLFDRLPLTRAVLDETMRLYPPISNISRGAEERDEAASIPIPAGATVYMPPYVLHRHEMLWKEPRMFRPGRFMPGEREKIDRFAFMPFGAGPRVCIAAQFAQMETVIVLASLVKAIRFDFAGGTTPRPVQRITLKPEHGMPMKITIRETS